MGVPPPRAPTHKLLTNARSIVNLRITWRNSRTHDGMPIGSNPMGVGGVLQILIEGNDRMGAIIKTQKNAKLTPKQSHAEFLSNHKTSLVALYLENYAAGIRGHYRRIFRWLTTFPTQKNPGMKNFNPKKVIWSSPSLEIWSTRAWGQQRLPAGYQILFSLGKVD